MGKLKKGRKLHGWVTGHGWVSHGGTWKTGTWGQNIAPKMLHVSVRIYCGGLGCLGIEMCARPHAEM